MTTKIKFIEYVSIVLKSHDESQPLAHHILGMKYVPIGVSGVFRKSL